MEQHNCFSNNHRTPITGKYECMAFVRGNVAYALDALPQTHVEITTGTPWAQTTIYLCGTHHTQFINRKPINITVPKEDTMTNIIIPTTGPEMDDLNAPFMTAGEIRFRNEVIENNIPTSSVTGSSVKDPGWALCVKCTKEIGSSWYHPVSEIRICMGAASAPSNRRGSFVKAESGIITNEKTGDQFIFDSSRTFIMARMAELRAQGHKINKVAKSNKTGEWYICWTPKS